MYVPITVKRFMFEPYVRATDQKVESSSTTGTTFPFTTASKSAFQDPDVRFVNLNVAEFDAAKHSGLPLTCDARVGLEAL